VARALANQVTAGGSRISLFMVKGAQLLSKWLGESERQLRLIFEQARRCAPSIVFFDEMDGIAPVRSSKQDAIHSSIVATLLALLDGLDDRGHVIVIGATNRPDAIDPALRRPGRFDRELYFPLPPAAARREILDVHTAAWAPPLAPGFKDALARATAGYCGADLAALCAEAALRAVRRRFAAIYDSDVKLKLDPEAGGATVTLADFAAAMRDIVPAAARSLAAGHGRPLARHLRPLLQPQLDAALRRLAEAFPFFKAANPAAAAAVAVAGGGNAAGSAAGWCVATPAPRRTTSPRRKTR
jgi:SpoVK/Ycf46/Vps4 family AAA+-type ATPase